MNTTNSTMTEAAMAESTVHWEQAQICAKNADTAICLGLQGLNSP